MSRPSQCDTCQYSRHKIYQGWPVCMDKCQITGMFWEPCVPVTCCQGYSPTAEHVLLLTETAAELSRRLVAI